MFKIMTRKTQSKNIFGVFPKLNKCSPWLYMVDTQFDILGSTFSASITIAFHNLLAKLSIFWTICHFVFQCTYATFPIPMKRTFQMFIAWRLATSATYTPANSGFMSFRQFASTISFRDALVCLCSCFWCHKLFLPIITFCNSSNFSTNFRSFSYVSMQVSPSNSTMISTKILSPTLVWFVTLTTDVFI